MPRFLGIGAKKAGTSWLAAQLSNHPKIWFRFFDRALHRRRYSLLPDQLEARVRYGGKFLAGALRGKVTGEFTPAYARLSKDRIALVHSWMPKVRLLYIMRDPVERAWAEARDDFPKYLGKSVREATESELIGFFDSPSVLRNGNYTACIQNWRCFFDRSQFFITCLEDVMADPVGVLRAAFRFLGVDSQIELERKAVDVPVYAGERVPMPEWVREYLENTLLKDVHTLETLIDRRVPWASRA
jgi:hypothetical protein